MTLRDGNIPSYAALIQRLECLVANENVIGSNPIGRSICGYSSMVELLPSKQRTRGPIPPTRSISFKKVFAFFDITIREFLMPLVTLEFMRDKSVSWEERIWGLALYPIYVLPILLLVGIEWIFTRNK